MMGGRYISTDNAYVGAQKVLITPDVAGKISRVAVTEGQQVDVGDVLFEIDPAPYRLAVRQAESKLALAANRTRQSQGQSCSRSQQLIEIARQNVQLKQNDVDRKSCVARQPLRLGGRFGQLARRARRAQRPRSNSLLQQEAQYRNQLLGNPTLPQDEYPGLHAGVCRTRSGASATSIIPMLRAPIAGIATQVDAIQLGRYVNAGTPVFAIMDNKRLWVDANPKETDITYLQIGQKATIAVDTFSRHTFQRHCRRGESRHRRAIRDPAAAERQRKLGQGRAARSGTHRARSK